MKLISKIFLALAILLQAFLVVYWSETAAVEQFISVLKYQNNGVLPAWSDLVFSIGMGWLFIPVLTLGYVIYKLVTKSKALYGYLAFSNVVVAIAMVYSMYPLHVMFNAAI